MDTLDPAGDFLRIAERYRRMSDEELVVLIPQSSELTPLAQQALASEVRSRGLKPAVEDKQPSTPSPLKALPLKPLPASFEHGSAKFRNSTSDDSPSTDSSDDSSSAYEEDRKLVDLCTVWSVRDALKVQAILDTAGIPFFMGLEKATGVDQVTSNFSKGVSVQIMRIGMPWAMPGMRYYEPEDDPTPQEKEEAGELVVRCPQCHSEEVVFGGGTATLIVASDDSSQKYKWICDACGYQWEDDGVATEE